MADPWPASLPPLPRLPASFTLPSGVIATQNDVGPALTRRRTTAAPEPFSFRLILPSDAALATFRAFFETTLAGGALPFETSYFGATRAMRFVAPPQVQDLGAERYEAAMDLEVLP